jgi:hypothetical protein
VLWPVRELSRLSAGVPGEGTLGDAEDLVAHAERGHVLADGLDAAGDFPAADARLGCADPVAGQPHRVRQPGHQVPDAAIDAGRVHTQQNLAVADHWPGDLFRAQDVAGLAVAVLDDRLHRRCFLRRPVVRGGVHVSPMLVLLTL